MFRRQIIAGQNSSRKGVQLKMKVLKDLTASSVAVNSCTKLYIYQNDFVIKISNMFMSAAFANLAVFNFHVYR